MTDMEKKVEPTEEELEGVAGGMCAGNAAGGSNNALSGTNVRALGNQLSAGQRAAGDQKIAGEKLHSELSGYSAVDQKA